MTELTYWLWLTLKKELPSRKITVLLEYFKTPRNIFEADERALSCVSGLKPQERRAAGDKSLQRAYAVQEICKKKGIKILTYDSPYYPRLLKALFDPPYVLYARYRDRIDLNEHATISLVGTRKATEYGIGAAHTLAVALAEGGMTVVGGMASGIDSAGASGALSAGGTVVAVLGCGVDICYPAENDTLMKKIIAQGMVLSEFPPGTPPFPRNFPIRNRIISGLSLGTVVVEAPKRSGSLITARMATEQNREVFVVPADITRSSFKGSNALLRDGAKLVLEPEDVLGEFRDVYGDFLEKNRPVLPAFEPASEKQEVLAKPVQSAPVIQVSLDDGERAVMQLLSDVPMHIDRLAEQGLSIAELTAALTTLEMKGLVRALPGKQYVLSL